TKVESFDLDHTKVKAPYVRMCSVYNGEKGDIVTKYDVRFTQPNTFEMESTGLHTLEHLLATYLREGDKDFANAIIDVSPMGCRTGFYITLWNKWEASFVASEVTNALKKVLTSDIIPAENEIQCGNYRLHNLSLAKEYAQEVLNKGLNDKFFE
ncbi:MAG: S-ribosylhomocysteine lyase, partial [Clostridia bacterium]|nr:S-ribosylhomocysteine lyase [Clostridia bacterium]